MIRLDSKDGDATERQNECIRQCLSVSRATGCELILRHRHKGCFAHTQDIVAGNGANWHYCWIFANNENNLPELKNDQGIYFLISILLGEIYEGIYDLIPRKSE